MRTATAVLLVWLAGMCVHADDDGNEVSYAELSLAPESHYNKDVVYEANYLGSSSSFPKYVEDSGLRAKKYILLTIGNAKLPAFVKKTDEMTKFVAGIRKMSRVKVLGKVKKFKRKPKINVMPHYYVLIEDIEVVETGGGKEPADGDKARRPPPGRRPFRPRRR